MKQRVAGVLLLALVLSPTVLSDPDPVADLRSQRDLAMSDLNDAVRERRGEVRTLFASQSALRDPGRVGVVLVPGNPEALNAGEVDALQRRLQQDADLWLLEETTHTHQLIAPHGIRVVPNALLQPSSTYGDQDARLVEATVRVANTSHEVLLSAPTLLDVNTSTARVVGRSALAFQDVNRSGAVEPGDPSGRHPVVARGQGEAAQLLVVADSGIFTNGMMQAEDYENRALLGSLLEQAPEGRLILDASRNDPPRWMAPPQMATALVLDVATSPIPGGLSALALAGLTLLVVRRAPTRETWSRHEHDLGQPKPLPDGEADQRLGNVLAAILADETPHDARELAGRSTDELARTAQRELGLTVPGDPTDRERAYTRLLNQLDTEDTP